MNKGRVLAFTPCLMDIAGSAVVLAVAAVEVGAAEEVAVPTHLILLTLSS